MGQSANVFEITGLRHPPTAIPAIPRAVAGLSPSARLIPGAANLASLAGKKNAHSVLREGNWASTPQPLLSLPARVVQRLLPEFFGRFHPSWLGVALMDAGMIAVAFLLQVTILGRTVFQGISTAGPVSLSATAFAFFLAVFILFAIQEGLYSNCCRSLWEECGVVTKAMVWTTSFASLSLFFFVVAGCVASPFVFRRRRRCLFVRGPDAVGGGLRTARRW